MSRTTKALGRLEHLMDNRYSSTNRRLKTAEGINSALAKRVTVLEDQNHLMLDALAALLKLKDLEKWGASYHSEFWDEAKPKHGGRKIKVKLSPSYWSGHQPQSPWGWPSWET